MITLMMHSMTASAAAALAVKSRSTMPGSKAADDAQKEAEALKDGLPRLPLIVMTARTSPDDLRQYMEAGMDGCVSKPLATAALLSTVRAAVPKHGRPLAKADNVETSLQKKKGAAALASAGVVCVHASAARWICAASALASARRASLSA